MARKVRVQNTRDSSVTLDPSDLQDRNGSTRLGIAWPANIALPKRPGFWWLEHAVLSALFVAWLVVAWGRISLFLSEPTATKMHWEKTSQPPAISICPLAQMNKTTDLVIRHGSKKDQEALTGNLSLQEFIRTSGLRLVDMISGLDKTDEYKANPSTQVFTTDYESWKTSVDYFYGGVCATLASYSGIGAIELFLRRQPEYEYTWPGIAASYKVILHGNSEYWGWYTLNMTDCIITNETTREELVITIDREVKPNLRRAPCESDPAYNIMTCKRHCYFDRISCRMEEDADDDGRPLCMASQAPDYFDSLKYDLRKGFWQTEDCPCPEPCTTDRFGFHLRPSFSSSDADYLRLRLSVDDVRRVIETFVTYTVWDMLADMGGYLGLLLGSSLLSLFSTVYGLAVRVCKRCAVVARRRCRRCI